MQFHLFLFLSNVVLVAWAAASRSGPADQTTTSRIDDFINGILQCTDLPGLNLAVVRDGDVFYTTGYGVKDVVTRQPVTKDTMFLIASVTKAFVATLMAKTFEENGFGGYPWSTKVKDVLPALFHLSDPYRSAEVTMADLLGHRTGMPRHDLPRTYGYSQEELVRRMQYLNFTADFRASYKYNNLMYGVAAEVIEKLGGGVSWEEQLTDKLLRPLRMTSTSFVARTRDRWAREFASTYIRDSSGNLRQMSLEIPAAFYGTISSPGGIVSNAVDMAKWLQFNIKEGTLPDGVRLVDRGLMRNTHRAVTVSTAQASLRKPREGVLKSEQKIALGWREGHYGGYRLCTHTGNIAGWMSQLTYLRDMKHGVFLNINGPYPKARDFITSYVLDLMLGQEPWLNVGEACARLNSGQKEQTKEDSNWDQQSQENANEEEPTINNKEKDASTGRNENKRDIEEGKKNLQISKYVGVYGHFGYGNVTLSVDESSGRLVMSYGDKLTFDLVEVSPDTFTVTGREPFWYMTYSAEFESRGPPDVISHVALSFEPEIETVFERDLKQADAPPPSAIC